MTSADPALSPDAWPKTFRVIAINLAIALVLTVLLKLAFHLRLGQLVAPFLVFAAPAIFLPPVVLLRRWEGRGAPPRHVALAWSLWIGLLVFGVDVGLLYLARVLRMFDPLADLGAWIFTVALLTVSAFFFAYFEVREIATRRATSRPSA